MTLQPFKPLLTAIMLATFGASLPVTLLAQTPGTLDPSFDGDGHVIADSTDPLWSVIFLDAEVVAQPTGKVFCIAPSDSGHKLGFYKFHPDGSPDLSFAGTGQRHMDFFHGNAITELEVQVQPGDGKLLVLAAGSMQYTTLARAFTHNADPDASFALDGTLDSLGPVNDHPRGRGLNYALEGFLIQPDGKIITWGHYNGAAMLARLNADGSLDTAFGTGGMALVDHAFTGYYSYESFSAMAILTDGSLIASGSYGEYDDSFVTTNSYQSFEARFDADGHLLSRTAPAPFGQHNQILPTPDGGFIACQYTRTIKVTAAGALDAAFAGTGAITQDLDKILLQPDGKLLGTITTGTAWDDTEGWIFRWLGNGDLDTTFGPGGHAEWSASTLRDRFTDLAMQADGRILVAGSGEESTPQRFDPFLLRYHSGMAVAAESPALESDIVLFPNPSSDGSFFLQSPDPIAAVTCWDALGRAVPLLPNGQDGGYQMAQAAAAGVYLLRVEAQGQVHVLRLLRQ